MADIPEGYQSPVTFVFDGSKATRVLGLKYRNFEETLKETGDWILSVAEKEGVESTLKE